MARLRPTMFVLASCLFGCPAEDTGDDELGGSETSGSESETGTDTGDTGGSDESGASCGVAAGVCCLALEECTTTEDCCDPVAHSCVLEGVSTKCIDLAAMCQNCLASCEGMAPPEVCESSCAIWCNPP